MEDELEDRLFYQTYVSHMKLLSRFSFGLSMNHPVGYLWKLLRLYLLRSEVIIFSLAVLIFLMYIQAVDVWSRALLTRLGYAVGRSSLSARKFKLLEGSDAPKQSWELKEENSAAYALKGRRYDMEDRFIINENINKTGVSLFAIFDGHGGSFAAEYAKVNLIQILLKKIEDIKDIVSGKEVESLKKANADKDKSDTKNSPLLVERKKSFKKTLSSTDDCTKKEVTDPELLNKLNMSRTITREVRPSPPAPKPVNIPVCSYIDTSTKKVNYGKLLTDELLAADRLLIEEAKKNKDIAGTTALLAILEGDLLTVANVGDSRGVMCDSKGNAIPLSFDHKPQQMREQKRIKEAGGFIAFSGVWRVGGILATSRALGDYPLKDKKFVIADPDILTFNLSDHKPLFVILATDGLWDTFSNEEAVNFIRERLHEPHYGAKSLTLQSYYRGSEDNITIIVINFKDMKYVVTSANSSAS